MANYQIVMPIAGIVDGLSPQSAAAAGRTEVYRGLRNDYLGLSTGQFTDGDDNRVFTGDDPEFLDVTYSAWKHLRVSSRPATGKPANVLGVDWRIQLAKSQKNTDPLPPEIIAALPDGDTSEEWRDIGVSQLPIEAGKPKTVRTVKFDAVTYPDVDLAVMVATERSTKGITITTRGKVGE